VQLKLIKGKFRQDALASTPFVAKSKQQPIKVRSTDTLITYKRCRYYVPLEILGTILLQTGSVLTYLLNCVISIAQVGFSRQTKVFIKGFRLIWQFLVTNKGIRLATRLWHDDVKS